MGWPQVYWGKTELQRNPNIFPTTRITVRNTTKEEREGGKETLREGSLIWGGNMYKS